ncbi:glycosyltransferase family 4 protein [uncultured Roseobacter sp.]|uniref:glycosyltransferase family 4 protein n=1 Tax=uncultured Roseobacter sp. TaxID=114847 RepID=UPI0026305E1E|nr:glycosyltransferase family 4 protein [uncultured Roseobacter sp.]
MKRVAFYAPMKPPTHPVPSGDRAMARALMQALSCAGYQPDLASDLQTRDGRGEQKTQEAITTAAAAETGRVIATGRKADWQAWVTYHNYYKAPDLLGPDVAAALDIPYILVEATRARKRLGGAWDGFARAAEAACDAAATICYLTERDADALRRDAPAGQKLVHLHPFLGSDRLPAASSLDGPMISVGMFRAGDKLASYRLIAETLGQLEIPEWRLKIVGDGPAREQVRDLMAPFGERVGFAGELDAAALDAALSTSSLLLWPGVNEAFGMVYLEAQAAGLPVVAQDRPGVRDVLAPGHRPDPASGASALASAVSALLRDRPERQRRGADARAYVAENHMLAGAARTLGSLIGSAAA